MISSQVRKGRSDHHTLVMQLAARRLFVVNLVSFILLEAKQRNPGGPERQISFTYFLVLQNQKAPRRPPASRCRPDSALSTVYRSRSPPSPEYYLQSRSIDLSVKPALASTTTSLKTSTIYQLTSHFHPSTTIATNMTSPSSSAELPTDDRATNRKRSDPSTFLDDIGGEATKVLLLAWFEDRHSPKEITEMLQHHFREKNMGGKSLICNDKDVAAVVRWLGDP